MELVPPLSEGKITQPFEAGEHPIFSLQTEPAGLTLSAPSGAFVNCAMDGVLTGKTQNADGTFRVCVLSGEASEENIRNSEEKPTYTFRDIKALWRYYDQNSDLTIVCR